MHPTREIVLSVDYAVNDKATNVVLSMVRFVYVIDIKTHWEHCGKHGTKNRAIAAFNEVISFTLSKLITRDCTYENPQYWILSIPYALVICNMSCAVSAVLMKFKYLL